jgi:hypothetical protein
MVYFEPSDLGIQPYLKNWFNTLPKDIPTFGIDLINELIEFSFTKGIDFLSNRKASTHFQIHRHSVVQTLCAFLSAFFEFFQNNGGFGDKDSAGGFCLIYMCIS